MVEGDWSDGGAPVTAGDWRLKAVATQALGFPSLAGGGKWRETSDRLNPCGFADRQSRPWSAAGAGGFEVITAKCEKKMKSSWIFIEENVNS